MTDSVEVLVSRAVDSFVNNEILRAERLSELCRQIANSRDKISMTVKLLAHKILSTDQVEASSALDTLNVVVQNSGEPIFEEINKLSTLNTFIQLLCSENQDTKTLPENKSNAILMLAEWKSSTINTKNVSTIYEMLQSCKIIENNSPDSKDDKMTTSLQSEDDGERFETISQLLHNESTSDIHRAKQMLDAMVKESQQESYETHENIMDIVEVQIQQLKDQLEDYQNSEDQKSAQELFERLVQLRLPLFQRVVEIAESHTQDLPQILTQVDELNATLQQYKKCKEACKHKEGKFQSKNQRSNSGVRFDPKTIKMDKNASVIRKPTPYSKMTSLIENGDYMQLVNDSNFKSGSPKL